jgi:hypothetical protein
MVLGFAAVGIAQADAGAGAAGSSAIPTQYRLDTVMPTASSLPELPGSAALASPPEVLYNLPVSFGVDSLSGFNFDDLGSPLDRPHATVRYHAFSASGWDMKIGMSTAFDARSDWQRFSLGQIRPTNLPTMHIYGSSRLADRWMLSVSAEGLMTPHGQGLDMDLRVDYSLSDNIALFGSYRLTDSSGEAPEIYGFLPSNSARFGVRLRF